MYKQFSETAIKYLEFYQRFISDWWHQITFWQYVSLMVLFLVVGYMWMSKGATGHN